MARPKSQQDLQPVHFQAPRNLVATFDSVAAARGHITRADALREACRAFVQPVAAPASASAAVR